MPINVANRPGLAQVSLGSQRLGNASIDVRLRNSKTRWGILGTEEEAAAIVYADIVINQPQDTILKSAVVHLSLSEHPDYSQEPQSTAEPLPSSLQFTPWYGPKMFIGEETQMKQRNILTPQVNVLSLGSLGGGLESITTKSQRWTFSGNILPGSWNDEGRIRVSYRHLKWELRGDVLEGLKPQSNRVIQTAFALTHTGKPFSLKVDIQGKLHRSSMSYQSRFNYPVRLRFPSRPSRGEVDGTNVIRPPESPATRRLDSVAYSLPFAMEKVNLLSNTITEEMVSSRPVKWFVGNQNNWAIFGKEINETNGPFSEKGRTALSVAAENGHQHVLKTLLSQENISLGAGDNEGRTSLSWAAGNGHLKAAELLLDRSKEISPEEASNLTKKDKSGRTPLSYACANGHLDMVNMLLIRTADLEVTDNEGRMPLAWAAKEGREDIVIRMLEHYAEKNVVVHDHLITTSLSLAALNDHSPIMHILVQAGLEASMDKRTWLNDNLKRAIQDGKLSLVKVIFQYEASADMQLRHLTGYHFLLQPKMDMQV